MALQNTMKAMGQMAGTQKPEKDEEMESLKRQYVQMRKGLGARSGEAIRQGKLMQDRAAYQAGGLGGAGLKMAQKTSADIQRGIAAEEANVGGLEAAATQALLGQRAEREFKSEEAEKERTFTAEEAEKGRAWEQKQRDYENKLNMKIANWNMTQTEINDRFNRFVAAKKAGLKSPDDWNDLYSGMSGFEGGFGRRIPEFPGATSWEEKAKKLRDDREKAAWRIL